MTDDTKAAMEALKALRDKSDDQTRYEIVLHAIVERDRLREALRASNHLFHRFLVDKVPPTVKIIEQYNLNKALLVQEESE